MTAPRSDTPFSLKQIAVPAFGPSVLYGVGNGAILPVIALSARELGASVALAGLIVSLMGIGSLVSNIPAAMITSRHGERRSMAGAAAFSVVALLLCIFATHAWMLGVGVFLVGMAASVFMLARQTYLIDAVPSYMRARALSTLGGTNRIGVFIGPFAGAAMIHFVGLDGAYWVAAVAIAGAGLIAWLAPEMTGESHAATARAKPRVQDIARDHAKVFLTLGLGILLVSALRSSRQVVIPLWADHLGLAPASASIIYGLVAAIDMSVFYPAGTIMDRHGRLWVALPSVLLMGGALMATSLTTGVVPFLIVSLILGFGNGISSGIVMTLGADSSPAHGRTEFLGIWRLIADVGNSLGPVILSAITAVASLTIGVASVGTLGLAAAAVLWRWLPKRSPPTR
ncbi:MFS transporter [Pigmentiphaga kullae]|uniref:Putative MFS family arabinose efflux permease n=1 Tax=Pigmentiphaga kullae TaxID=151784 RepID=A0A4Q7NHS7_9BURK|nr:MFS transporter [Pigmentiphaga kullae]RZS84535.1 putative MFS family arabinose efflux permease [Pigmentiphaga kullae]